MSAMNADAVQSRSQLVTFVRDLREQLRDHPERWENRDLDTYLEALAAWAEDMDGYFEGRGEPVPDSPSWSLIAQLLKAASIYE